MRKMAQSCPLAAERTWSEIVFSVATKLPVLAAIWTILTAGDAHPATRKATTTPRIGNLLVESNLSAFPFIVPLFLAEDNEFLWRTAAPEFERNYSLQKHLFPFE
jgi:hypothetical protein